MARVTAQAHGRASELALEIFGRALDAIRADRLVEQAVQRVGDELFIHGERIDLSGFRRVHVLGAGKAAPAMAAALLSILGPKIAGGLVVGPKGSARPLGPIEAIEACHPAPDESSLAAGERLLEYGSHLTEDDLVIFALSGGASALAEAPIEGLSLADLQAANDELLRSGLSIDAINAVRRRLSRIKAGGLALAFRPAAVAVLVLSDVVGNRLASIGSGPFVPPSANEPPPPFELFSRLPESVRLALAGPPLALGPVPTPSHYVIGSVSVAVHAALDAARDLGLSPYGYADPMRGEARAMARTICSQLQKHIAAALNEPLCVVFGGETVVTVRGKGRGGRCQEMAVAAAPRVAKMPGTCFLAAGTDGRDGPTGAAGGIVDLGSLQRAKQAGQDQRAALAGNDSYRWLEAAGGLVFTGPTDTNLNDLTIAVYHHRD